MQIIIDTDPEIGGSPTHLQIGYAAFRIFAGFNLFMHGFMRVVTGVNEWAMPEAETFAETFLPMPLVFLALYLIPPVQLVIGACIALGLYRRWALFGGLMLMFILMFGHLARQNWSGVHIVMHYALYYWILLALMRQDWLAVDRRAA